MNQLPKVLIYSRLLSGLLLLWLSYIHASNYKAIAILIIAFGLLSDIFDGIIARKLGISNENLRRLDSGVDQLFWLSVTAATYIQCQAFFFSNSIQMIILLGVEALTYIICFVKFRKEVATHAISSKFWTLSIFATIIQVVVTCDSSILFQICFYLGILTRLEIIAIILIIQTWTNDVPSLYHAILIRKGKTIKRNGLFNG